MSSPYIIYGQCPECGLENSRQSMQCEACGTKLVSEDQEGHERYIAHLESEDTKNVIRMLGLSIAAVGSVAFISSLAFGIPVPILPVVVVAVASLVATYKAAGRYWRLRKFLIEVKEMNTEPNKAMETTPVNVTDRAPSSTLRAIHLRVSSLR